MGRSNPTFPMTDSGGHREPRGAFAMTSLPEAKPNSGATPTGPRMPRVTQPTGQSEAQSGFARIYEAHYRSVVAYAQRRSLSIADADEIVSETFLTAWRRLDVVPAGDEALPWLFAVARRVIANRRRADRRRSDLRARLARQRDTDGPGVDAGLMATEEQRRVLESLSRLKFDDQELLRLVAWEDLSHRQVGQVLGCTEAAVAVRLHRARARLTMELAKEHTLAGHDSPRRPPAWMREGGPDD